MRYFRKVIKIRGQDSPNVRYGLMEQGQGKEPSNRMLLPGVLSYDDYLKRMATWDEVRQCIGLKAEFYEGAETLLFPLLWLDLAEQLADRLVGEARAAKGIGVDPGEGVANTSWSVVDEWGLIRQQSKKTMDTSVITGETIALMNFWRVPPERVVFDAGGGGKEHADRLKSQGYPVRMVGFGEGVSFEPRRGIKPIEAMTDMKARRYTYKNRRAQLYGALRNLLDPSYNERGFAIPSHYFELRRQLGPIPLLYDSEGRLYLPPKHKKSAKSNDRSLDEIIGCSPDEADSFVLAIYAMQDEGIYANVGAY